MEGLGLSSSEEESSSKKAPVRRPSAGLGLSSSDEESSSKAPVVARKKRVIRLRDEDEIGEPPSKKPAVSTEADGEKDVKIKKEKSAALPAKKAETPKSSKPLKEKKKTEEDGKAVVKGGSEAATTAPKKKKKKKAVATAAAGAAAADRTDIGDQGVAKVKKAPSSSSAAVPAKTAPSEIGAKIMKIAKKQTTLPSGMF